MRDMLQSNSIFHHSKLATHFSAISYCIGLAHRFETTFSCGLFVRTKQLRMITIQANYHLVALQLGLQWFFSELLCKPPIVKLLNVRFLCENSSNKASIKTNFYKMKVISWNSILGHMVHTLTVSLSKMIIWQRRVELQLWCNTMLLGIEFAGDFSHN
jgi:hypothetical protein